MYQIHALGEFGRHGVRIQLQGILIEAQAHPQALVVCVALLLDVRHIHAAEHLVLHVVDHVRRRAPQAQGAHVRIPQARHHGGHTSPHAQAVDRDPALVHKVQTLDIVQDGKAVFHLTGDSHVLEPPVAVAAAGKVEPDTGDPPLTQPAGELRVDEVDLVPVVAEAVEQDHKGYFPRPLVRHMQHPP